MNIREISGEAKGPDWRSVAYVAASFLGASLILITISWVWPKKEHRGDPQAPNQIEAQVGKHKLEQRDHFSNALGNRFEREVSNNGQRSKRDGRKWCLPDLVFMKGKSKKNKRT
ncbi:hypothetical protein BST61_g9414 [Cercospora zeina]